MDAETINGFEIGDAVYPIPQVMSLDMDEAEIFWDLCGHTIETFSPDNDGEYTDDRIRIITALMRNPRFRRALMHIAYRREHPQASYDEISGHVGKASNMQSYVAWIAQLDREDDAVPPSEASTSEQTESSLSSAADASRSSGSDSQKSTGPPVALLPATGTGG